MDPNEQFGPHPPARSTYPLTFPPDLSTKASSSPRCWLLLFPSPPRARVRLAVLRVLLFFPAVPTFQRESRQCLAVTNRSSLVTSSSASKSSSRDVNALPLQR